MMQLKKTVLDIVTGDGNDGGVLFEAPPQGNPRINEAHAGQLAALCEHIKVRTQTVVSITYSPHRVGNHSCVAVKLAGTHSCVNLLLTITGTLRWPRTLYTILCKCLFSEVTVQAVTELDNKAAHRHAPVPQRHRPFL
jgi:hypothetical protein